MKKWNFTLWFLRLFPEYRKMEKKGYSAVMLCDLYAAKIRDHKLDKEYLKKKIESDSNLIESLNRYITALETKTSYQADLLKDLKRQLEELVAKKNMTE